MIYGFEIKNSSGNTILDTTSIGLQIVYETTLTAISTDIVFTSKFAPFYFKYTSMHPSRYVQVVDSITNITPGGAPVDTYTYRVTIDSSKTIGPVRLIVLGGDMYTPTLTQVSVV